MNLGQIALIPFPFADVVLRKLRPVVVVATTKDKYEDIIVVAISSVIPSEISINEFEVQPNKMNGLRVPSVVKVDRIATLKKEDIHTHLGMLDSSQKQQLKKIFANLPN